MHYRPKGRRATTKTVKQNMKTIEGHDIKIFTDNVEESALEHPVFNFKASK